MDVVCNSFSCATHIGVSVWASKLHFFECVVVLACCPVERSVSIVVCAGCGSCFDRS